MSGKNPELLRDVLKRVFVPYPESWHAVDIVEPANEPQLDLFGDSSCNQVERAAQSPKRLR